MDNRIFNVNGEGKEMLRAALELAHTQIGLPVRGYIIDPNKGMILLWHNEPPGVPVPPLLFAGSVVNAVWDWLQTEPDIKHESVWDREQDDVNTSLGWRVYCEDWGHVGGNRCAIVAVKPAYMWHGK